MRNKGIGVDHRVWLNSFNLSDASQQARGVRYRIDREAFKGTEAVGMRGSDAGESGHSRENVGHDGVGLDFDDP